MTGFIRRFGPNFATLKAGLDAGGIGKSEPFSISVCDPAPPPLADVTVSDGPVRDMMSHHVDMAHFSICPVVSRRWP